MKTNYHITIIEDDDLLRLSLSNFFSQQGYVVSDFPCAQGVVEFIEQGDTDLLLCDIMLPNTNGLELVAQIKQIVDIGIIFISGKTELEDRISGLALGVDDYICKPIDLTELQLRTSALLRRLDANSKQQASKENSSFLTFFDLELNIESRLLSGPDKSVELGESEFSLLFALFSNRGKICSRAQLSEIMPDGQSYLTGRALDQLLTRLRKKIQQVSAQGNIVTFRGKGYMLPLN